MDMDKEQQIEEMAVIGCVRNPQAYTAEECGKCDFKHYSCNAYKHAKKLYNAGYHKQDEVLTEFAERLKEKYGKSCSEDYPLFIECTSEDLDELLKEFL